MLNGALCTAVHSICWTIVRKKETARSSQYTFWYTNSDNSHMHTGTICDFTYDCYMGLHTITWMIMAQWGNNESKSWSILSQNDQFSIINSRNEWPNSLDISLHIKHRHLLHYNSCLLLFNISLWIYVWSINTGSPYTCRATMHMWLSCSSNVLLHR